MKWRNVSVAYLAWLARLASGWLAGSLVKCVLLVMWPVAGPASSYIQCSYWPHLFIDGHLGMWLAGYSVAKLALALSLAGSMQSLSLAYYSIL